MSTVETISPVTGTVTESQFDQAMRAYAGAGEGQGGAKFTRVVDSLSAMCRDITDESELGNVIGRVNSLVSALGHLVREGEGYTPPKTAGFGSDNAATIAEKLLGIGQSAGETRKSAKNWGKNVR